jgi:hypothetical protein
VRRLTSDELEEVAAELGAVVTGDVSALAAAQRVDGLVEALAGLLVAIVRLRPFDRRNHAVAVAAIDLLAGLNRRPLDLSPPEEVAGVIAEIRDGLADAQVCAWLRARTGCAAEPSAAIAGPCCPACGLPLREALAALPAGRILLGTCGNCGQVLGRPVPPRHRPRPRQEA